MKFRAEVEEAGRLLAATRWLALATLDERGAPSLSYVPFAAYAGTFGIVVSGLAAHTANLRARPASVSVLVVADEREAPGDPYACTRLSVAAGAQLQPRGGPAAAAIWTALERRHGATVQTLRTLPDFEAFALTPAAGRLILGFASAHDLDAGELGALLR